MDEAKISRRTLCASIGAFGVLPAPDAQAGTWRIRPKALKQDKHSCWAACISTLTRYSRLKYEKPAAIIRRFKLKGMTGEKDALISKRLPDVLLHYGLEVKDSPGAGSLTEAVLRPMLKQSHVIAIHSEPRAVAHAVVIYGVDKFSIVFMDPWVKEHKKERIYEFGGATQGYTLIYLPKKAT